MTEDKDTRPEISVGADGQERFERDELGLDIDPATGRAYASQGDAVNQGLGVGGRFHDGIMVPRSFTCAGCGKVQSEAQWGHGFKNCGALRLNPGSYRFERCGSIDLGPGGRFNLCGPCIDAVVSALPALAAVVKAINGGDLRRGG